MLDTVVLIGAVLAVTVLVLSAIVVYVLFWSAVGSRSFDLDENPVPIADPEPASPEPARDAPG